MRTFWILPLALVLASPSYATPPGDLTPRGLRNGANHHLGDDGFVAAHGHTPTRADEHARVHDHFAYVRKLLASRPPTKPELAERRAQLLHYFDDYIAKDITPLNVHVPWRTPVFIDDRGTICAVGYLIEQSAGRALPDKIAATHRYDFIEDIAKAMPEVRDWVASSGFTLDELASIQPGYEMAEIEMWSTWNLVKYPVEDGEYDDDGAHGRFLHGRMEGEWTLRGDKEVLRGRGTFDKGAASWRSFYPDGKLLAAGRFVENVPHGGWTFYHPSGRVAGEGAFNNGYPDGAWTFYYDTDERTPIAKGTLRGGTAIGHWQHFDEHGVVYAESREALPRSWRKSGRSAYLLSVVPGADGVGHQVHEGRTGNDENHRLDMWTLDGEKIFVVAKSDQIFDAAGHQLAHGNDGAWTSFACAWTGAEKTAARRGDLARLHGLLDTGKYDSELPKCSPNGTAVPAARAAKLDTMLAPDAKVRAQSPRFIRDVALGNATDVPEDLADLLAHHMSWYVEWPHVHGKIVEVFATLPGFNSRHNYEEVLEQMGMK